MDLDRTGGALHCSYNLMYWNSMLCIHSFCYSPVFLLLVHFHRHVCGVGKMIYLITLRKGKE